jgi:signal transduction histidine kinase
LLDRPSTENVLWLRAEVPSDAVFERPGLLLPAFRYAAELRDAHGLRLQPERPELKSLRLGNGSPRVVRWQAGSPGPVFLRVFSPTPKIGPLGPALLGDERELNAERVASSLPSLLVGCLLVLLGALAGLAGLAANNRRLALFFAAFSGSTGCFLLSQGRAYDWIGIGAPAGFALWAIGSALAPAAAVSFVRAAVPGPEGKLTERLAWWGGAGFGVAAILDELYLAPRVWPDGALAVELFGWLWPAHRLLLAWCLLWTGARLASRARQRDRIALILLAGGLPLVASILSDVLAALGFYPPSWRSELHWAALVLVLSAGVAVQRRYAEASEARERYTELLGERFKEREALMQDLHDGVGALTTNVRMLAELGQRQPLVEAQSTLRVIGDLASDSTAELRNFITGLDPELTWDELVAHLRELGGRLLEGRAVELRFAQHMAQGDQHPSARLATTLLSIYREALTNALRHAKPSYVSVDLELSAQRVRLRVENDGGDQQGSDGAGGGRGLRGMRRRAGDLGGTFELDLGSTPRIDVELPLL